MKFAELPVTDQDRAVRFYTEKIGLKVAQDAPYTDGWRWIELVILGAETRIVLTKKDPDKRTGGPALVLAVDDVEAAHRELSARGVIFTKEPSIAPWNHAEKFALFQDSEIVLGT